MTDPVFYLRLGGIDKYHVTYICSDNVICKFMYHDTYHEMNITIIKICLAY